MIGLDTNVLVRYITQDDAVQSAIATDIIERKLTETHLGFISTIAITETAWVLERSYGFSAKDIAATIERILQIDVLVVEHEQEVFTALVALKSNRGSFADALIGAIATTAGCSHTVTFDRKALRLGGFAPAN
jgi:predicted nucleic-acid-binding protein